jgi:hypothetical protein
MRHSNKFSGLAGARQHGLLDRLRARRLHYGMNLTQRLLPLALIAACSAPPERTPPQAPEPLRARAALATLHVENATPHRLSVLYRFAVRGDAEVEVGHVPPLARSELAPVPAGEPLVLIARTAAGAEFALPARSFDIDGEWTWRIPARARFVPRSGGDRS